MSEEAGDSAGDSAMGDSVMGDTPLSSPLTGAHNGRVTT